MLEKTSLTTSQTQQETNLNIWSKSATFAASKGKNKFIRNNKPKEEFASCELEDNIPNYIDSK
jgi:hypothetical protein